MDAIASLSSFLISRPLSISPSFCSTTSIVFFGFSVVSLCSMSCEGCDFSRGAAFLDCLPSSSSLLNSSRAECSFISSLLVTNVVPKSCNRSVTDMIELSSFSEYIFFKFCKKVFFVCVKLCMHFSNSS